MREENGRQAEGHARMPRGRGNLRGFQQLMGAGEAGVVSEGGGRHRRRVDHTGGHLCGLDLDGAEIPGIGRHIW